MKLSDITFRDKVTKLAAFALTSAIIITLFIWAVVVGTVTLSKTSSALMPHLTTFASVTLSALFLIIFFVIWFIIYIQYIKESEDIYSRLREKLEGPWLAEYDYFVSGTYLYPTRPRALYKFTIGVDKKLQMEFDPKDNLLFYDVDQNFNVISLRNIQANKYSLVFYYKHQRRLQPKIAAHIDPEFPGHDTSNITVETFGILTFEEPKGSSPITHMNGEWFDLNGNLRTLGMLMKQSTEAAIIGRTDFRAKLSSMVSGNLRTAKMGEVEFRRQA